MLEIPEGIDLSVTHGVRPHIAARRLRKQLEARRKSAGKGPNGRNLCLWCLKEVPIRCSSWCSRACDEAFFIRTDWNTMRRRVANRDKGVCAACNVDTAAEFERFEALLKACTDAMLKSWGKTERWINQHHMGIALRSEEWCDPEARAILDRLGIDAHRTFAEWFDVDHIVPLAEGGTNELDNLRTLCIPCHKKETKAMHRRAADDRRSRMPLLGETA